MAENEKQKNLSRFIESEFLKRSVTKLIVSVSVLFSLFFSLSQSTLLSFVHHFNFYFSTLPFKLLSHNLDKNYTFLLFNGLLVFLAGLFSLSSPNKSESFKNYEDDLQPQVTIMDHQMPLLEQEDELENTETQQEQNAMQKEYENIKSDQAEETETEMFKEEKHEEQEEKEEEISETEAEAEAESSFFIEEVDEEEEEEEEEEGGGNDKLSNEELNKKFDDFIRKMKEELRIEARQQLIMV